MLTVLNPAGALAQASAANEQPAAASATVADVVVTAPTTPESLSKEQTEALQNAPVAATIITQDQIEAEQITKLEQAKKLVPSLTLKTLNIQNLTYNIRGIGNANGNQLAPAFSGVPIYVDDVYYARPGTTILDIPDLVGLQVLKGPQSTGGGWDSTSGVVKITTAGPSFTPEEKVAISYGSYNYVQLKATATGPIDGSDKAAFRLTAFGTNRNGYIQSVNSDMRYNDWKDKIIRGQVLLAPDNNLTARFSLDYAHANFNCCLNVTSGVVTQFANGNPVPDNFFMRAARVGYRPQSFDGLGRYNTDLSSPSPQEAVESAGASAHVQYRFDEYTLSSITAFRHYHYHCNWRNNTVIDVDTALQGCGNANAQSVQQEFKFETPKGQPIEALAGLFLFWENFRQPRFSWTGGQTGAWFGGPTAAGQLIAHAALDYAQRNAFPQVVTKSAAPYAQAVWHATPDLDLTGGVRYSYTARWGADHGVTLGQPFDNLNDAQRPAAIARRAAFFGVPAVFSQTADTKQGLASGMASASLKFTPQAMGYVTYAHGVRPGGPNVGFYLGPPGSSLTVKPEELDNYEVGLKADFFDQRLQANIAAFWMNDRNYITNIAVNVPGGTTIVSLANAPRVISRGVEVDLRAQPIDGLSLYGAVTYDDAFYESFPSAPCPFERSYLPSCDFTGQPLSIVPKWAFTVGGEYSQNIGPLAPFVETPVIGFAGADFAWQSSVFSGSFGDSANSIYSLIGDYGLLSLHAGIKAVDGKWNLTAWIHNALNKHYFVTHGANIGNVSAGLVAGSVGDPLMAGATFEVKF